MINIIRNNRNSNLKSKNLFFSFIFLNLFILPHTLVSFLPMQYRYPYYYVLIVVYIIYILAYLKIILKKDITFFSYFILIVLLFGTLNLLIKNQSNLFHIIFPIMAIGAYKVILVKKFNFSFFNYAFFLLYIIMYLNYYTILPKFFGLRPKFNEDMLVASSSNVISIGLNNTLFAYIILNFLKKAGKEKLILIFSVINILLIVMQQSRAGIIVSIILFLISLYHFKPQIIRKYKYISVVMAIVIIIYTIQSVFIYTDNSAFDLYRVMNESRGVSQFIFLKNLTWSNFFCGYNSSNQFKHVTYTYNTYNVFLDYWNNYTILNFLILVFFLFYRLFNQKKFLFPNYFFIPFFFYAMIESIYLPTFWDVIIYLLMFVPANFYSRYSAE